MRKSFFSISECLHTNLICCCKKLKMIFPEEIPTSENVCHLKKSLLCVYVSEFQQLQQNYLNLTNYYYQSEAVYGEATHDAFIWSQCEIKGHLASLIETTYLLGDSGYPLREYLLTPISNVLEDSPEGRYNAEQKRAHSTIARTFGILKDRWRCLLAARELHYHPDEAGRIILACCVLHMCIRGGVNAPELSQDDIQAENSRQIAYQPATSATNALRRE